MALLPIEILGSEVLRRRAADVAEIDEDLRILIGDMFETMYDAEGIGLAAPQIGISRRVIVVDVREEGAEPFALINPRLVETGQEREKGEEGCLSIPGLAAPVDRPLRVAVEGMNADGHPVRIEGEGLLARCLQHEIDHLDGVLFIDHVSPLKRRMLLQKWKRSVATDAVLKAVGEGRSGARG
ncbi:peptide deformylase [soil metagenome]